MSHNNKIPTGWLNYTNMGAPLSGTKFVPLKTPLKPSLCHKVPPGRGFTPQDVLEQQPRLKLIINLTKTVSGRYYNYEDFVDEGVPVVQIQCEGHGRLPPPGKIDQFFHAVDDFIRCQGAESEGLIGVHCTHGLNRTGFFICKYLIDRMNMSPIAAIDLFEAARGHQIERQQYVKNLMNSCSWNGNNTTSSESLGMPPPRREPRPVENWRERPPPETNSYPSTSSSRSPSNSNYSKYSRPRNSSWGRSRNEEYRSSRFVSKYSVRNRNP